MSMKFFNISFLCIAFSFCVKAQNINDDALFTKPTNDSIPFVPATEITISLLLPFDEARSNERLNDFFSVDEANAEKIRLKISTVEALDFYEGFQAALNIIEPSSKINLQVYDVGFNDTLLESVLKRESLANSNIIIGSSSVSGARVVAEYCKRKHIINVQPFVISKTVGFENPYLIKIEPSIEAHIERMYKTIVDYYSHKKVFVLYSNNEKCSAPALLLDSLFKTHNADSSLSKINYKLAFIKDSLWSKSREDVDRQIDSNSIVVFCNYETNTIEKNVRNYSYKKAIVFGMPTWIDNELLRADYLNNTTLHFTDIFFPDSSLDQQKIFATSYPINYKHLPSRSSYLGFDIASFLLFSTQLNGLNFIEKSLAIPYNGIGYNFNLKQTYSTVNNDVRFFYYENTSVHQFKLDDYQIQLVE